MIVTPDVGSLMMVGLHGSRLCVRSVNFGLRVDSESLALSVGADALSIHLVSSFNCQFTCYLQSILASVSIVLAELVVGEKD